MKRKHTNRWLGVVWSMFFAMTLLTMNLQTRADSRTDQSSINLIYKYEEKAFAGQEVRLYQIAQEDGSGNIAYVSEFSDCPVNLEEVKTEEDIRSAVKKLSSYIKSRKINPDQIVKTDENGSVVFAQLVHGFYLVEETNIKNGSKSYVFDAVLVGVPALNDRGETITDIIGYPKGEEITPTPAETSTPTTQPSSETTNPGKGRNNPGTGDRSAYGGWIAVMIAAMAALIVLGWVLLKSKNRRRDDENQKS